jgi:NAD(P)-dependent dehydrogenase (short-subunit alcohol dehydrogenase family)
MRSLPGGHKESGRPHAQELAHEGANVCLTYRKHEEEAEEVRRKSEVMGRKALAVKCDIASFEDAAATVQAALEAFGSLEILVNNAGMNWDGVSWKMTEEQWDRVIDVNLKGYFNFIRHTALIFQGAEIRQDHQHHFHQWPARQVRSDELLRLQSRHRRTTPRPWPRNWALSGSMSTPLHPA